MKIKKHLEYNDQLKYQLFLLIEEISQNEFPEGSLLDITIETHRKSRSNLQNRYYWGVVIKILSEEIGYAPDVMHNYMKHKFGFKYDLDMPDNNIHHYEKSTRDYTTVEFEAYMSALRNWAGEFLNTYIPLPNETPYNYLEVT